jgi:hypothetical protein
MMRMRSPSTSVDTTMSNRACPEKPRVMTRLEQRPKARRCDWPRGQSPLLRTPPRASTRSAWPSAGPIRMPGRPPLPRAKYVLQNICRQARLVHGFTRRPRACAPVASTRAPRPGQPGRRGPRPSLTRCSIRWFLPGRRVVDVVNALARCGAASVTSQQGSRAATGTSRRGADALTMPLPQRRARRSRTARRM